MGQQMWGIPSHTVAANIAQAELQLSDALFTFKKRELALRKEAEVKKKKGSVPIEEEKKKEKLLFPFRLGK
ncbi:hypothetical protein CEXT_783901 [Caerostris extrusa]|uniref:Uncharacterized protein n=1 Tax=Caerostris extrusa TaxID=172846 RepID=A0AAV4XSL9_CAEEX|nr:hypothetical protein CEXT_783901 [Caerostris extrusa]